MCRYVIYMLPTGSKSNVIFNCANKSVSQSFRLVCDLLREQAGEIISRDHADDGQPHEQSPVHEIPAVYGPDVAGPSNSQPIIQSLGDLSYETSSCQEVNLYYGLNVCTVRNTNPHKTTERRYTQSS